MRRSPKRSPKRKPQPDRIGKLPVRTLPPYVPTAEEDRPPAPATPHDACRSRSWWWRDTPYGAGWTCGVCSPNPATL